MKKPLSMSTFILFLFISIPCFSQVASPYAIGPWQGFRLSAISYTFDDNCPKQISVMLPIFNSYGYKMTFYTITGPSFIPNWAGLQAASLQGHEVGSHTVDHISLGTLTGAQQTNELANSQATINAQIPTQKCVTFAYPNGSVGNSSIMAQYYFACRNLGALSGKTPANFLNVGSIGTGVNEAVKTIADFNAQVDSIANTGGWLVYYIHAIDDDPGWSPTPSATLQASLDYLKANPNKCWEDTFGHVARYIKERNASSVSAITNQPTNISVHVTNTLDPVLYNFPITLRCPLPANWLTCFVRQHGTNIAYQITSSNYIMFDVIPNTGDVTLLGVAKTTNIPLFVTGLAVNYSSPGTNYITWSDITNFGASFFVYRNTTPIITLAGAQLVSAPISQGVQKFTDILTSNGKFYYAVASKLSRTNTSIHPGTNANKVASSNWDRTPPGVPSNLLGSYDGIGVTLNWGYNASDPGLTGFRIYRGSASGNETLYATVGVTGTYYDSAVAGHKYYYKVSSFDNETPANESALSSEVLVYVTVHGQKVFYKDATNTIVKTWSQGGTPAENNDATAYEGSKYYRFTFDTSASPICQLANSWSKGSGDVDVTGMTCLQVAYRGPTAGNLSMNITVYRPDSSQQDSVAVNLPTSATWKLTNIPISRFTNGISQYNLKNFVGIVLRINPNSTGTVDVDNIVVLGANTTNFIATKVNVGSIVTAPSLITNNANHVVVFSLKATSTAGAMTNVSINLSQLGGASTVKMTNISGWTLFRYSYNVLAGVSRGNKTIPIIAYDNSGNPNAGNNFLLTVTIPPKLTVTNFAFAPGIITNNTAQSVQFNLKAVSATGTVTNVSLDLTSIGGTVVKMNNISGATLFQFSYNVPAGAPAINNQGLPTSVRDTIGFQNIRTNFHLTIRQGILLTNFAMAPASITNNISHVLVFNLKATSGVGFISSVSIDLSQIGGTAGVNMTNISGATLFRYAYATAVGLNPGIKSIPITAFDSTGKQKSISIFQLTVMGALTVTNITTAPTTIMNDTSHVVVFSLKAVSRVGAVTNVSLNLSQLSGPATVKMSNISGATLFRYAYTVSAGIATGSKSVALTVFDSAGNQNIGNNFHLNVVLPSKVIVTNFAAVPGTITNNASHAVVFNVKAVSTLGTVTNVSLNLSQIGGSAAVKMTSVSGSTLWTCSFSVAKAYSVGLKSITVTGKDSLGNIGIKSNTLTITAPPPLPPVDTFKVSPNPLILSGSSENVPMTITYNAAKNTTVIFEVFNLTGSEVKILQGNVAKKITWNGTNDKGQTLASGIYFLIMKVDGAVEGKPVKIGVIQ